MLKCGSFINGKRAGWLSKTWCQVVFGKWKREADGWEETDERRDNDEGIWRRSRRADTHQFSLLNLSLYHIAHPISLDSHRVTHTYRDTRYYKPSAIGFVMTSNPYISVWVCFQTQSYKTRAQKSIYSCFFLSCSPSRWTCVCVLERVCEWQIHTC